MKTKEESPRVEEGPKTVSVGPKDGKASKAGLLERHNCGGRCF